MTKHADAVLAEKKNAAPAPVAPQALAHVPGVYLEAVKSILKAPWPGPSFS
jgi:hypothetical protein